MTSSNDELKIAVVLEAFLDRSLEDALDFLSAHAPEVTHLEVGTGGYAPHPHCDTETLLQSADERKKYLELLAQKGFTVAALNVWGNPLHPDEAIATAHDEALRNAVRLATDLGVDRVIAMGGCPGGAPGDVTPHFAAGGWLPYLEDVYEQQWNETIEPYWTKTAEFARSINPDLLICLELHPGTVAFNVDTFERVASLGPSIGANLDPSHFMWMGMDALRVASRIAPRVGHIHGKDVSFHDESLALNGLLDARWPKPAKDMPWTFTVPGRGHDLAWWTELLARLGDSRAHVVSIEHEDPFVTPEVGVPEGATFLAEAIALSEGVNA